VPGVRRLTKSPLGEDTQETATREFVVYRFGEETQRVTVCIRGIPQRIEIRGSALVALYDCKSIGRVCSH